MNLDENSENRLMSLRVLPHQRHLRLVLDSFTQFVASTAAFGYLKVILNPSEAFLIRDSADSSFFSTDHEKLRAAA
jgi:hypothetical protein